MSASRRLFFALWPDEPCVTRLRSQVEGLLGRVGARALPPTDWHVTLCFLGAVDERTLSELRSRAAQIHAPGFDLPLERVCYWRAARVVAVMAGTPPEAAVRLSQALRELARQLGLAPDEKPLRPHVTLMRSVSPALWKGSQAPQGGGAPGAEGTDGELGLPADLALRARQFYLAESLEKDREGRDAQAGRYRRLARWALEG